MNRQLTESITTGLDSAKQLSQVSPSIEQG
jgi:hypothetical protein